MTPSNATAAKQTDEKAGSDNKGQGFPQILHDRSRTVGMELHKLLLSLSTGGVAVYFVSLNGNIDMALSWSQKVTLLGAMFCMAIAAVSGIVNWRADCRRNYLWASALQSEDKEERSQFYRLRDRHLRVEKITGWLLIAFFILGISLSALYITSRVLR